MYLGKKGRFTRARRDYKISFVFLWIAVGVMGVFLLYPYVAGWYSEYTNPLSIAERYVASKTVYQEPSKRKLIDNNLLDTQAVLKERGALVGDVLLVYADRQKAIIYRPSTGMIVGVIETSRGDGLDIAKNTKIIIFYSDDSIKKAESIAKNIVSTWQELDKRVYLSKTDAKFPGDFVSAVKLNDKSQSDTVIALTEKVAIPINLGGVPTQLKPKIVTGTTVVFYIK